MIEGLLRWFGYEKRSELDALFTKHLKDGIHVNEDTALTFSAVYRAVSLISGSVSTLPLHVYERMGDSRKQASDHPLAILLDEPNDEMDGPTFRETLTAHVLTHGNGYAEIERGGGAQPLALHPLAPDKVTPKRVNGVLVYEVQTGGRTETLPRDKIFHLSGLGWDGVKGYSPIQKAKQSIALGLEAEQFGERFFSSGTHLGGLIEAPQGMTWRNEDHPKQFLKDFAKWHRGVGKSHEVAMLEGGLKWVNLGGIPPEAAQFLQTRKFQVTEIARWFGIPPHLLYDLERSTFSNIEHQGIEFLTYSLRYWLKKWERAFQRLLDDERYFVEHVTQDLVRADIVTRYNAYKMGRDGGWLSINDIRKKENEEPVEGGDAYLQPLNMVPVGEQPKTPDAVDDAERSLLSATLDRLIRNEANAMRRAAKKPDFKTAVDEFYQSYEPVLRETLEPIFKLRSARGKAADINTFIRDHIAESRAGLDGDLEQNLTAWETRAARKALEL